MSKGEGLRDRAAAAIIDSAAAVMAERGGGVSMHDIAVAARVGRATLYRYFPSREALLQAMAAASVEELGARIADADLRGVPVEEAIARLVRAFVAVGGKYVALSSGGHRHTDAQPGADALLAEPVRELLRRGVADGTLRADLGAEVLFDLFSGLVKAGLGMKVGVEGAAAAVTAVFLDGARAGSATAPR